MSAKAARRADNDYGNGLSEGAWLIETFLENQVNDETQKAYATDLRGFVEWLADTDLLEAGVRDVIAFRNDMMEQWASATVARKLSAVRTFYAWAVCHGMIRQSPACAMRTASASWASR